MLVKITFYERPPEGGKRVRKLASHEIATDKGLIGALDSLRGSVAKSQDQSLVERVARVQIEITKEADGWT